MVIKTEQHIPTTKQAKPSRKPELDELKEGRAVRKEITEIFCKELEGGITITADAQPPERKEGKSWEQLEEDKSQCAQNPEPITQEDMETEARLLHETFLRMSDVNSETI